jgi:VCBS repeat-containing protein
MASSSTTTLSSGITTTSMFNTPQAVDDNYYITEDQSLSLIFCIDVMANDSGGNAKTLFAITEGSESQVTVNSAEWSDLITRDAVNVYEATEAGAQAMIKDGKIIYNASNISALIQGLGAGEILTDHITYTIRLGNGTLSMATLTVTITGTNDAPTISVADDAGEVTEDATSPDLTDTGTITFDDLDLTDTHSVSVTTAAGNTLGGTLGAIVTDTATGAGDGTVTWTYTVANSATQYLGEGETATETFTVTISDGKGGTVSQDITITVTGANDGPTISAADDAGEVTEDATSPTLTDTGTITFDDLDLTDTHSVSVTNAAGNTLGGTLGAIVTDTATGAGDGTVTWTYTVANSATQYLGEGETATETFTVTISDGKGGTVSQDITITITGTNDAPVVSAQPGDSAGTATPLEETNAGLTTNGTLTVTDVDTSDTVTMTKFAAVISGVNTGGLTQTDALSYFSITPGTLDADTGTTGNLSWSFNSGSQAFDFLAAGEVLTISYTVRATDDSGAGNNIGDGVVTIRIVGTNDAAILSSADEAKDETNAPLSFSGQLTISDVDGDDTFQPQSNVQGTYGTFSIDADGNWTYLANDAYNELNVGQSYSETFTVKAADGTETTVKVTINGTNDAPVTTDDTASGGENEVINGTVADNVTDPDDSAQTFSVVGSGPTGLTFNSDGTWSFDPGTAYDYLDDNESTTVTFDYKANDGDADSNTSTVTITINGANDAPVAGNDSYSTNEDTSLVIAGPGILGNDTDVDVEPLSAILVTGPAHGTLVLNSDGSFTYTPEANYNGSDSFTYKANDGTADSNVATVNLTVNAVNDAPVISAPASIAGTEDNALAITGLSVSDVDAGGSSITVTLAVGTGALSAVSGSGVTVGGTASSLTLTGTVADINAFIAASGVSFAPPADFNGPVTLTMTANDGGNTGSGGAQSDTETITLNIAAVNDAPVADDDSYTTDEDTPLTILAAGVLTNDDDIESDALTVATVVTGPANGSLTVNSDGSFIYIPDAGFSGTDSFTYKANDGTADSNVATVTITVNAVNDAPVITSNGGGATASVNVNENTTAVTTVVATDVDSPSITYSISGGADAGLFTIDAGGNLSFINAPDFEGPGDNIYEVIVKASDGDMAFDTQTITVNVQDVVENVAPVANSDVLVLSDTAIPAGQFSANWFLNNDTDADGNTLSITAVSGLTGSGLTANFSGGKLVDITGTAVIGNYNLTYTLSDGTTTSVGSATLQVLDTQNGSAAAQLDSITLTSNDFSYIDVQNGADSVIGGTAVTLVGRAGIDVFIGSGGNDTLNGGAGNDALTGGIGTDSLTGGTGDDVFDFNATNESGTSSGSRDIITDFEGANIAGGDRIDLQDLFGGTLGFTGTTATANSVWYATSGSNIIVSIDVNGNTTADIQIQVNNVAAMNAGDFIL